MKNSSIDNNIENSINVIETKKIMTPHFFVDSDQIKIKLYIIFDDKNGQILNVSVDDLFPNVKNLENIAQVSYQFVLTKPNYQQLSRYKQLAMYVENKTGRTIVNPFKLRNYLILNHLKKWTGVKNEYGEDVNLQIDTDDTLTQKSLQTVYKVNSNIIDVLMSQYQARANIII